MKFWVWNLNFYHQLQYTVDYITFQTHSTWIARTAYLEVTIWRVSCYRNFLWNSRTKRHTLHLPVEMLKTKSSLDSINLWLSQIYYQDHFPAQLRHMFQSHNLFHAKKEQLAYLQDHRYFLDFLVSDLGLRRNRRVWWCNAPDLGIHDCPQAQTEYFKTFHVKI